MISIFGITIVLYSIRIFSGSRLPASKRYNPLGTKTIYFNEKTSYTEALRETESDFRFVYFSHIPCILENLIAYFVKAA